MWIACRRAAWPILARWQLRGPGSVLLCSHRGRRHAALAEPDGWGSQPIRNYNTYLWYLQILMRRRSTDQIIADILEICLKTGVAKTNVVYRTNLNFKTAMPYLDLLTRGGLLETVPGESTIYIYKTTAKGRKALKALRAIEEIIPKRLD